jgi:hypothetical protein
VSPTADTLFAYPVEPHVRRHGPSGYTVYSTYKPWLRDEFCFRCVYCLFRERWFPNGEAAFSVDHIEPQAHAAELICEYTNLVYACLTCNSIRRDLPVLDPCTVGYGALLRVRNDGTIEGLQPAGQELIQALALNRRGLRDWRCNYFALLARIRRARKDRQADLVRWFGYPDDLPDLAGQRPPGGNDRPDGIHSSHRERRARGELPGTY